LSAESSVGSVELNMRLKSSANQQQPDEEQAETLAELADLEEAAKEARLVALRLRNSSGAAPCLG